MERRSSFSMASRRSPTLTVSAWLCTRPARPGIRESLKPTLRLLTPKKEEGAERCACCVCIIVLSLLWYSVYCLMMSLQSPDKGKSQSSSTSSASLFGRLGSLRKVKKSPDDEKSQGFVVQYLGCQMVARPDGLECVKEAVQQLAVPKVSSSSASPVHLVEFDVSPSGINLTDPQKKFFGRKHFPVKSITYVLRIRWVPKTVSTS